ncbi:hypothetical protein SAY87_014828 [Trapa incisa]|uniref:Uncharacterized protein n=1 Tax=Trapa incisa TaxID=236973 RepID=A0AAN7H359_9MYRT|nr:hypothetical protein SAY87_014828 [Trapa incisa]
MALLNSSFLNTAATASRRDRGGDGSYSSSAMKDRSLTTRRSVLVVLMATCRFRDTFSAIIESAIAISGATFLSLLLYFSFSSSSLLSPCPGCDRFSGSLTTLRNIAVGTVAATPPEPELELPTDISHILFGIGGSASTWDNRRHYCELWWRPNITRGFVWLDESPQKNVTWPEGSPPYRVSEDTSRFEYTCWYGQRSAIRIARIVKESFDLGLSNISRWFVMGDDDTVFFTENLVTVLSKYDHNQMYYIGANSESVEQDIVHSYSMAYGGGGFAISYPLAAELVKVLDGCINRYAYMYGSDQKIHGCLTEIGVPLIKEPGFHQMDIRESAYGLLAKHPLVPLVSFHHLDYVDPLFPGMSRVGSLERLRTAYELDPDRTLQHSFCHDLARNWSVSVSWGYTVRLYPWLVIAKDLDEVPLTFKTWKSWTTEPFAFDTGPYGSNQYDRPLIYFLEGGTRESGSGHTFTNYPEARRRGR